MALGIVLTIAALSGIVLGAVKKNTKLLIASIIILIIVLAVWVFFYYQGLQNPY